MSEHRKGDLPPELLGADGQMVTTPDAHVSAGEPLRDFVEQIHEEGFAVLGKIPVEWHPVIANKLIEAACGREPVTHGFRMSAVAENLSSFEGLTADIAYKLIDIGFARNVMNSPGKFEGLEFNDAFAREMWDYCHSDYDRSTALVEGLSKGLWSGLSAEVAIKFMYVDPKFSDMVVKHIEAFAPEAHKEIALNLIQRGHADLLTQHVQDFQGLDLDVVKACLAKAQVARLVFDHPEIFQGTEEDRKNPEFRPLVFDRSFAEKAMKADALETLRHMSLFPEMSQDDFAGLFVSFNPEAIAECMRNFNNLSSQAATDLAHRLADRKLGAVVLDDLERFPGLDHNKLCYEEGVLMDHLKPRHVAENLYKLKGLDSRVAVWLLSAGLYEEIKDKMDQFTEVEMSERDQGVWKFFTDGAVPLRVKQSQETVDLLAGPPEDYSKPLNEFARFKIDHLELLLRARVDYRVSPEVLATIYVEYKMTPEDPSFPEALMNEVGGTAHDPDIRSLYDEARKLFGDDLLLDYLNRPDLSVHDALYYLPTLKNLLARNNIDPQEFAKTTMRHVAMDHASYEEGTAHHLFGGLIDGAFFYAMDEMIADENEGREYPEGRPLDLVSYVSYKAQQYPSVKKLQDLVRSFEEKGSSPFESWKAFKKFGELTYLLGRANVLRELERGKITPKLREFVEKLAFHPNIVMDKVVMFWKHPAEFFGIDDEHTSERINAAKKPKNYLSLPYLGMTAENLRDAYVEGALDRLQVLPPMEMTQDPEDAVALHEYLRRALGQRRDGIEPEAQSARKSFTAVQEFCKKHGVVFKDLWELATGVRVLEALNEGVQTELREIVFDRAFGMKMPEDIYRVRIGRKSDPDMTVAGNDTASCMPFGSGKNNVYMFNPNCVQLVVERKGSDGKWRTAAQSVMTVDLETAHSTPTLIREYKSRGGHMRDVLTEGDTNGAYVLTADNIEVAKNEEGKRVEVIRRVYEAFMRKYLLEHGGELGVDLTRVAVGKGYTPKSLGLDSVPNTLVPLAPMGYSDNVHADVYVMHTDIQGPPPRRRAGIAPLRTPDTIDVAMLEGKAYSDNVSLLENLHGMQNNLIGMRIANEHFGRPNLSFMYRDQGGIARGYCLAYEGVNGGLPEVYISDIAADPEARMAGGKLITEFFNAYMAHYGTEERPYLPIITNARGKTSFQILQRQLERLARKADLIAEMQVVSEYQHGTDTFYNVRVHLGRTPDDVAQMREKYEAINMDGGFVADQYEDWKEDDEYAGDLEEDNW